MKAVAQAGIAAFAGMGLKELGGYLGDVIGDWMNPIDMDLELPDTGGVGDAEGIASYGDTPIEDLTPTEVATEFKTLADADLSPEALDDAIKTNPAYTEIKAELQGNMSGDDMYSVKEVETMNDGTVKATASHGPNHQKIVEVDPETGEVESRIVKKRGYRAGGGGRRR